MKTPMPNPPSALHEKWVHTKNGVVRKWPSRVNVGQFVTDEYADLAVQSVNRSALWEEMVHTLRTIHVVHCGHDWDKIHKLTHCRPCDLLRRAGELG